MSLTNNPAAMLRAADVIRRSQIRTRHLVRQPDGNMGVIQWEALEPAAQDAWLALTRRAIRAAEATG